MEQNVSPVELSGDQLRAQQLLADGERLLDIGRVEEARQKFWECLRLQPDSAPAHNKLGVCYARLQQWEKAREQFLTALSIDAAYAPAHSNMGNLHREAGRLDDAVAAYMEALRHDPDYYIAHHNLGVVYKQQGKIDEAVSHLKRAHRLERTYARAQLPRGSGTTSATNVLVWIAAAALLVYLLFR